MLGARATDLENRLAVQGKMLAERGMENHQLRQQLESLQTSEQSLREQVAFDAGEARPHSRNFVPRRRCWKSSSPRRAKSAAACSAS